MVKGCYYCQENHNFAFFEHCGNCLEVERLLNKSKKKLAYSLRLLRLTILLRTVEVVLPFVKAALVIVKWQSRGYTFKYLLTRGFKDF